MKPLQKLIGTLNTLLIILAGLALLSLMGISVLNVILRAAGFRFGGGYELVGFAGAVVAAAALGQTQERKDHVPVDIITRHFPRSVNLAIDLFKYLLKFAFSAIAAWCTFEYALHIRRTGELSETLKIPFYPFIICVAAGFAVLACTVVLDVIQTIAAWRQPAPAPVQPATEEELVEEEVPLP